MISAVSCSTVMVVSPLLRMSSAATMGAAEAATVTAAAAAAAAAADMRQVFDRMSGVGVLLDANESGKNGAHPLCTT